jgi:putative endopeptidase
VTIISLLLHYRGLAWHFTGCAFPGNGLNAPKKCILWRIRGLEFAIPEAMYFRWIRPVASIAVASVLLTAQEPSSSTPLKSGVDLSAIDKSVDPCQNFYLYACGTWIKNNPIPPQYSRWGRFNELADRNQAISREILEDAAKHRDRSPIDQMLGAFYSACMDETAIEKAGAQPVRPAIDAIQALPTKAALAPEVAQLQRQGVPVFFRFAATPDFENSRTTIADVDQGGLGLPDKTYYELPKDEATRQKYVQHIANMFRLLGIAQGEAEARAKSVMAIETSLASASLDRVSRRNPHLVNHKLTLADLEQLTPNFAFKTYLAALHTPGFESLNVAVPEFFKNLNVVLENSSLDDLKSYLIWHYVSAFAGTLSQPFVDENFDFYGRFLTGAKELQPRWKRCAQSTDRELGDALGQKYVARAFAGQSKQKTRELVGMIEKEMAVDIDSLSWMGAPTKQQALQKLKGVTNKIGYPDKWKSYSSIEISDTNYVADVQHTTEFELDRRFAKIGGPVDRQEFNMTPPTVNAYYSPMENNINFPAGILQPPFYNSSADMAVNFGGIGAVIGHELTHGFDDQGRQYDADGNLRDWWTKQDDVEFRKRADCIANEYSGFSPVEGANVDGRLTLGENGADNAGIRLAYMALLGALQNATVDKEKLDGYTPQQRFFLGYAQVWCANERPEALRNSVRTDPHSPGQFRVIGVVQNDPEFASAFGCLAGQRMVSANACRVW